MGIATSRFDAAGRVWSFEDVDLLLGGVELQVGRPNHAGYGWIPQHIAFGSAKVHYWLTADGREQGDVPVVVDPFLANVQGLGDRQAFQSVVHLDTEADVSTLWVQPTTFGIGDISLTLPADALQAELVFNGNTTPAPGTATCAPTTAYEANNACILRWFRSAPSGASLVDLELTSPCHVTTYGPYCNMDFLPYYVADEEAQTLNRVEIDLRNAHYASVPLTECDATCRLGENVPRNVMNTIGNLVLDPLTGDWLELVTLAGINRFWNNYCPVACAYIRPRALKLPVIPEEYKGNCQVWFSCDIQAANANWIPDPFPMAPTSAEGGSNNKEMCLDAAGNPTDSPKKCRQLFKLGVYGDRINPETRGPSRKPYMRAAFTV